MHDKQTWTPISKRIRQCLRKRQSRGATPNLQNVKFIVSQSALEKWLPAAMAVSQPKTAFSAPIRIMLGEAVDLARFTSAYWEPVKDPSGNILRPGLALAGAKLSPTIGSEILELQDALQSANTSYLLTVAPTQPDVRARAQFVLSEIAAALEWWLDDGIDDDRDQQLASLKSEYADGSTAADSLAAELSDYAALARQEAAGLQGLGGFEMTLVDEAENLAHQLRERPTTPVSPENTRRALDVRNRVATLLVDRMAQVRSAARFVFRNQPQIAREASSAYERRRRHARKAIAANKATTPATSDVKTTQQAS